MPIGAYSFALGQREAFRYTKDGLPSTQPLYDLDARKSSSPNEAYQPAIAYGEGMHTFQLI